MRAEDELAHQVRAHIKFTQWATLASRRAGAMRATGCTVTCSGKRRRCFGGARTKTTGFGSSVAQRK